MVKCSAMGDGECSLTWSGVILVRMPSVDEDGDMMIPMEKYEGLLS